MRPDIAAKFFTNTDATGRFIVKSARTGKTYAVEPIDKGVKTNWGSIDPASGELMHKKGDGKFKGAIKESESLITEENGFINVQLLEPGTSPFHAIEVLDAKYPTVGA